MKHFKVITENRYLVLFVGILVILGIASHFFVSNCWGHDISLMFMSTAITVFFVNLMLNVRKNQEWKNVRELVNNKIVAESVHMGMVFLSYIDQNTMQLLYQVSPSKPKNASDRVISALIELSKKESAISAYADKCLLNSDSLMNTLFDVKRNLSDIQLKYAEQLSSEIIEKLERTQVAITTLDGCINLARDIMMDSAVQHEDNPSELSKYVASEIKSALINVIAILALVGNISQETEKVIKMLKA